MYTIATRNGIQKSKQVFFFYSIIKKQIIINNSVLFSGIESVSLGAQLTLFTNS